jgi:ATP-dependent Lon protease
MQEVTMKKNIDYANKYPLLPLRDVVVFPHMVIPLFVGREMSINALDAAMKGDRLIVLATQTDAQLSMPKKEDIYEVGTISEILQLLKLPDGTIKVLVEGISRVYISDLTEAGGNYFQISVQNIERPAEKDTEFSEARKTLIEAFEKYIKLNKKVPQEALTTVQDIEDPSHLADVIASHVAMRIDLSRRFLRSAIPTAYPEIIELINGEIEVMYIEKMIREKSESRWKKPRKNITQRAER